MITSPKPFRRINDVLFALLVPVGLAAFSNCSPTTPASPQSTTSPAGHSDKVGSNEDSVVIFCSIDREFAEPILTEFEKDTGIRVHRQYDTEAGKTTGLVNRLLAERDTPRADVWWSSEIFGTLQLASQGVLAPYSPTTADEIPTRYRDKGNLWTADGLRGRVIAYDPKRVKPDELPRRWADLTDPRFKGRVAMADPRFGTTRGHMAVLYSLWGKDALTKWYEGLRANAYRRADGNSHAVLLVNRGAVDFAATDTDDVIVAKNRGDSIAMCYPDLDSPDGSQKHAGTLWIPCSIGLVKGARHPEAARKLIDVLVSSQTAVRLAQSESSNVPVRDLQRAAIEMTDGERPFSFAFENLDDRKVDGSEKSFPYEADVDYAKAAAVLKESDRLVVDVLLR